MISRPILIVLAASWFLTPVSHAQRRPEREFKSENEKFILRVKPGRPGRRARSVCSATLTQRERGRPRLRWERPLVNEIAPMHAAVRDDGRFVVTLGEFPYGGVHNALVIYGDKGQLLRHFLLTDLLESEDWQHVERTGKRIKWLDDVKLGFESHPDHFVAKLKWDRELRVDLKTLQIVRGRDGVAAADTGIPPEILAALSEGEAASFLDEDVLELLSEAGLSEEDIALLASGDVSRIAAENADEALEEIRESLGEELPEQLVDLIESAYAEQDPLAADRDMDIEGGDAPEGQFDPDAQRSPADMDAPAQAYEPQTLAGSILGEDLPAPNVETPTDYLSWINSFTETEGPGAAPYYLNAADNYIDFEGDAELRSAAVRGDPDALNSPEVREWLDANQAAIADFRDGNQFEYNGLELQSENGDLIGALLPHLSNYRGLTRALVTDGRRMLADGDTAGALDAYVDAITAGQQAARGQTLIDSLVGISMQAVGTDALLDAFDSAGDDLDYTQLAARMEQAHRPTRPLTELVQFERSMFMDAVQRVFEMDPATGEPVVTRESLERFDIRSFSGSSEPQADMTEQFLKLDFDQTRQAADEFYDSVTRALELPFPRQSEVFAEIEKGIETYSNPMLRIMLPALSRASFLTARGQSAQRGAELVANIKAYQQQFGELPQTLEAFGDRSFTIDPFTGGRFRYIRDGDGFRLYSTGGNGIDDGGVHDPRGEENDYVIWPRQKRDD